MSHRLIAAVLAAAVSSSAALAQTNPTTPAAGTSPPAAEASHAPSTANEDVGRSTRAAVKACQAKWKVEKAKPGTKLGAKAFYTFMANCL
ncbi:MAG: hypothetical protein P4L82_10845 [Ancalomicrobiaceae bacterium]|nr:hypothetical protein [Ancalomicrobiaceae bacterium]